MDTIYTIEEVALMLKVSIYAVRQWVRMGKLDHMRVGKMIRISQEQLEDFITRSKEAEEE